MSQLLPCSSCSRHVLVSESQCPFCGSSLKLEAANRPRVPQGLRRAQLFALGASLAAVACSDQDEPQLDAVPIYGATAAPGDFGPGATSTTSSAEVETGASTAEQSSAAGESTSASNGGATSEGTSTSTGTGAPTGDGTRADAGPVNTDDAGAGDAGSDGSESTADSSRDDWTSPGAQPVYGAVPIDATWKR